MPADLVLDLAVWRAARDVDARDLRPAGARLADDWAAARCHRWLARRVDELASASVQVWELRIIDYVRRCDDFTSELASRLDRLERREWTPDSCRISRLPAVRYPTITRRHPCGSASTGFCRRVCADARPERVRNDRSSR
ncbi:MAG: hypothetical protein ACRDWI_07605 [Jiangellaceae bacterium]